MANVIRPPTVTNDSERRQMLAWVVKQNGGIVKVARESGVSRGHIHRLIRGFETTKTGKKEYSVLDLDPHTISGLLGAFSMSLERAWEMFGIPQDLRSRWRGFENPSGEVTRQVNASLGMIALDTQSLQGMLFLPAGAGLEVLTNHADQTGLQIVTLNGQLYALPPADVHPDAQLHGAFAGVRISDQPEPQ
ncbi:hypothetical protein [Deinococcus aquaticus]|uniref:Transcriptional regulator n=1 Tax=Deinococcus aquaticus TaxID=328692 RepID=A0ABY7V6C1_9DEIO|nr:hypothetical protein [Deinococcus aquaticus]WDA60615.1 hypothetical protein M8445_16750 [Deinococcus aquaticus]